MIQFSSVYKSYNGISYAIEDVSLKIPKGDFALITGVSGAGKTTFLKLITREITPTKGAIIVNGRNISVYPRGKIFFLRKIIGIIFQDFRLLEERSVFDNISIALKVRGFSPKIIKKEVFKVLKWVGLSHKIWERTSNLSGGEKQRIAIARAVVYNPEIILADEPTGNLDEENAFSIMEMFKSLNMKGATIVVATHNRYIIENYGKTIIHLKEGRLEKVIQK